MRKFIMPFPALNEASNLIKMGVPKEVAKFIHTLTGEETRDYYQRATGVRVSDKPVPHDVERSRRIRTKQAIIRYMKAVPDDSPLSAILWNPETGFYTYVSYKSEPVRGGNQYRVITMDDNGRAIAKWDGTLGQLVSARTPDNLEMWVLESPGKKVETTREERKAEKRMTDAKFIDLFIDKYTTILERAYGAGAARKSEEFYAALTKLTPEDFRRNSAAVSRVYSLAKAIQADLVDKGQLETKLNEFTSYLMKNGDYESRPGRSYAADLNDVIEKHTLMGAFHAFAEFIMKGKILNPFKKNYLEELGF